MARLDTGFWRPMEGCFWHVFLLVLRVNREEAGLRTDEGSAPAAPTGFCTEEVKDLALRGLSPSVMGTLAHLVMKEDSNPKRFGGQLFTRRRRGCQVLGGHVFPPLSFLGRLGGMLILRTCSSFGHAHPSNPALARLRLLVTNSVTNTSEHKTSGTVLVAGSNKLAKKARARRVGKSQGCLAVSARVVLPLPHQFSQPTCLSPPPGRSRRMLPVTDEVMCNSVFPVGHTWLVLEHGG